MTDVFLSYSHKDQSFADLIIRALEAEGLSVWWDHTIPPGQTWDTTIAKGIAEARVAIVVWSPDSSASDWVKEEASIARSSGKYLPVQVGDAPPPIGFSRVQAAQLKGWNGERDAPQWQLLIREARRIMSEGAAAPSSVPSSHTPHSRPRRGLASGRDRVLPAVLAVLMLGLAGTLVGVVLYYQNEIAGLKADADMAGNNLKAQLAASMNDIEAARTALDQLHTKMNDYAVIDSLRSEIDERSREIESLIKDAAALNHRPDPALAEPFAWHATAVNYLNDRLEKLNRERARLLAYSDQLPPAAPPRPRIR